MRSSSFLGLHLLILRVRTYSQGVSGPKAKAALERTKGDVMEASVSTFRTNQLDHSVTDPPALL